MINSQRSTRLALLTLGLLSIMFGIVLFELLYFAEHLPAFGLLPAFFAVGIIYKGLEQIHKHESAPRVVTVEFDWLPRPQEAY